MEEFYTGGFSKINKSEKALLKDEDFQEEDVWAVMKERGSSSSVVNRTKAPFLSSASGRRIPAHPRSILHHQSSAPVNVPDRSKIYNKKSSKIGKDDAVKKAYDEPFADFLDDDDDDDEDGDQMIPPHEFIARELARTPIVSYSMCEGIGRTLKGRDLSRLRNAILTMTGFLES